jgi:hypothetical protein
MHFQVNHAPAATTCPFSWHLWKKDGPVARSARSFNTEKEARSDIAQAKTAMKGAARCKVLSPGEEPA